VKRAALSLFVLALVAPVTARADSYEWSGRSGRFTVHVWLDGFNEGAGEGGWDEADARDFAGWARRFNDVIPPGARVTMTRAVTDDDGTTLSIRDRGRTTTTLLRGDRDVAVSARAAFFAPALAIVARHFRARVPPVRAIRLYTLQVFASRSPARARAFAASLEARGVAARGAFFSQKCHPCTIPETRVRDSPRDGLHRVVLGVYDRAESAHAARAHLARDFHVASWVAELR